MTASEVGSSSPKDIFEVFPVWSSDSLPSLEEPSRFRFVPFAVDADAMDGFEGVAKDCKSDECCDEKSLSRSEISFRMRSNSDRSEKENVMGFPAPSMRTTFKSDLGWLAGLT